MGDGDSRPPTSIVALNPRELPPLDAERSTHDETEKHQPPPSTKIIHRKGSWGSTKSAGGVPSRHAAPCASASACGTVCSERYGGTKVEDASGAASGQGNAEQEKKKNRERRKKMAAIVEKKKNSQRCTNFAWRGEVGREVPWRHTAQVVPLPFRLQRTRVPGTLEGFSNRRGLPVRP